MIVEINGKEGLVRDISTGAILNTDQTAYENYLANRERIKKQRLLNEQQAKQISDLKCELNDLKRLVSELINSKT